MGGHRNAARGWTLGVLAGALCYLAAAWFGLDAEIVDGLPARFWPAAGIALASIVLYGRRAAVGVALGSLGFALATVPGLPQPTSIGAVVVFVLRDVGAALLATQILRRLLGPNSKDWFFQDPWRFLLVAGPISGLVGAFLGPCVGLLAGTAEPEALPRDILFSWIGHVVGVWVATPLILTVLLPEQSWFTRRIAILNVVVALVLGSIAVRAEEERRSARLESEWTRRAESLSGHFEQHFLMLRTTSAFLESSETVEPGEFVAFTAAFLRDHPEVLAVGTAQIPNAALAAAEAGTVISHLVSVGAGPRVADRERLRGPGSGVAGRDPLGEPEARAALTREALEERLRVAQPDGPSLLLPPAGTADSTLLAFVPATGSDPPSGTAGVVFLSLAVGPLIEDAIGMNEPSDLAVALRIHRGRPITIYAQSGSHDGGLPEVARGTRERPFLSRSFAVAGETLELTVSSRRDASPHAPVPSAQIPLFGGLLIASFLTLLIAIVAERTSRVELLVAERTLAVRRERDRAEAADRAKGAFLANMSHEIRTPMNGVLGIIDILDGSNLDGDQRQLVRTMRGCGTGLLGLLDDILDMAKIESGRMAFESVPLALRDLCTEVLDSYRATVGARRLELRLAVDPGVPARQIGDPTRIRQILANLVGNAVKFTPAGSIELRVSTETGSDGHELLRIEVQDTGVGIPAEKLGRILEPFTQADTSTTRLHGGSGLGLSIVRSLASLMDGRMEVESTIGVGSTFRVVIPLHRIALPAERGASAPPTARGPHFDADVLLVEDNPVNRMVAGRLLERLGCRVTIAEDGAAAVEAAAARRFDLVLMDLAMPSMDGLEATRRIRAAEAEQSRGAATAAEERAGEPTPGAQGEPTPGAPAPGAPAPGARTPGAPTPGARIPIVALTANVFAEDVRNCLAAGMDAHLGKPVRAAELERILARFLTRPAEENAA